MPTTLTVALVGNPNAGKSTLFNALSGLRQHTGNYPGVTVEMKKGQCKVGEVTLDLIDLPGTYSLAPRSPDELVSVDLLLGRRPEEPPPDVIVSVVADVVTTPETTGFCTPLKFAVFAEAFMLRFARSLTFVFTVSV
jgi:Fe2+ transport system protein B